MILIGLTGGVATGKSTVAKMFQRLGVPTVDTDKIAHRLMLRGTVEHKRTVALLGPSIIGKNGEIDRRKVADIIFGPTSAAKRLRRGLEKILHPAIWRMVRGVAKGLARHSRLLVIEVPLLFEVGWHKRVDWTIVVACPHSIESKRCKSIFKDRIRTQMDLSKKAKLADFVIDSSYGKAETFKQVKALLKAFEKGQNNL